jgi:hypothetical protein
MLMLDRTDAICEMQKEMIRRQTCRETLQVVSIIKLLDPETNLTAKIEDEKTR